MLIDDMEKELKSLWECASGRVTNQNAGIESLRGDAYGKPHTVPADSNSPLPPIPFSYSRMSTRRFASLAADLLTRQEEGETPKAPHHDSPVVAFIIGLSIILLASILNAAGLNLTKLDHVRFRTCVP